MGFYCGWPRGPQRPTDWRVWLPTHPHFSLVNEPRYDDWMVSRLKVVKPKTDVGYRLLDRMICDVLELNSN